MAMPAPDLADAATCGEDLARNVRQAITIAPETCPGCADYHITSTLKRLIGKTVWERGARKALLDTLRPVFAELAARDTERIDVVIAACADTAVLSTCAHAAWLAGETILSRTHFAVVDRCRTPLVLCQDYGDQHGLQVGTEVVELLEPSRDFPADLIVLHNLLPFVPEDLQAGLLATFGRWLKTDGRLVIWNPVLAPDDRDGSHSTERQRYADIKAMVEDGTIAINEPKEALFARLERRVDEYRPGEQRFVDIGSLPTLMASAGLEVRSVEAVPQVHGWRQVRGWPGKLYTIVVASRASR